jgi:hypothetical protein
MNTSGSQVVIKAGRLVKPNRWSRPGETERQALARYNVEFRAFSDAMRALRDRPLSTAQEEFSRFFRDDIAPAIRALGFKGSGLHFKVNDGDYVGQLDFQKSRWNVKSVVEFTASLGAAHAPSKRGYWSSRLGHLMPDLDDTWWILPAGSATQELFDDLMDAIRSFGTPALQIALDAPGYPPNPSEHRPRSFDADGPASKRWTKAWQLFHTAPQDPLLRLSLLDLLETEPSEHARGTAAEMLAFVGGEPLPAVAEALEASARDDESVYVRIMARYALGLLQKPALTVEHSHTSPFRLP